MAELEALDDTRREVEGHRRLLRRDPQSLRFAELADQARRQGGLAEATALCARGLLQHPHYATGHVVMGEIFWDRKLEEKAEREWREALRLDPGHPRAHLRLGALYLERGDTARAIAAVEAALLANPQLEEARDLLERAHGRQPKEQRPGEASEARRKPSGGSPPWLSASHFEAFLEAVRECPAVESAMLANGDGMLLAGGAATASPDPERAAASAVELARIARRMIAQLGAGKLRSALVRGKSGGLRCIALDDTTLIAALAAGASVGAASAEIDDAISAFRRRTAGGAA